MADNHVLQLTGEQLDETLRKVSQLSEDIADKMGNFRHITTINVETDGVREIKFTVDKDGNPFSCSELFIYATFPAAPANQVYVGTIDWIWMYFCGSARTTSGERTMSLELKHIGGGYWRGKAVFANAVSAPMIAASFDKYDNLRSNVVIGEKVNNLFIYGGNADFSVGTAIEVYGR